MKSDISSKHPRTNIVIYLLFIVVLIVLLVFYYMEKSSLETKLNEAASRCNELSEQLYDASLELKHKQNEIDFLYGKTDLAEQLNSSMKTLKIQLPTNVPDLNGSEIDNAELCEHNMIYLGKIQQNDLSYVVEYFDRRRKKYILYHYVRSKAAFGRNMQRK